ncbi:hypothetical protein JCM17845_15560 [Iodidimonas gelatinilytica]|uniref:Glycine-rich domain-containing protein n=1 Tax=Iodidimonas gelatinilytica TaxID=1236966 RepID=A0A5A7MY69_9PROT|nr:hypothetical protein [Iodidimonas gelatinilytica]GER00933.1 hypothetical protein JCM17845_15560 [Iodidimonas gelatinilytica]
MAIKTLTITASSSIPIPVSWVPGKPIHVTGWAAGGSGGGAGGTLSPAGGGGGGEYFEGVVPVIGGEDNLIITIGDPGEATSVAGAGNKGGDLVLSGALALTLEGGGAGAGPGTPDGGAGGNGGGSADEPQPAQHALILDTLDPDRLTVIHALRLEKPDDFSTATEVAYSGILGGWLASVTHLRASADGNWLYVLGNRSDSTGASRSHLLRFSLVGITDLKDLGAPDQIADVSVKSTLSSFAGGFDISSDGTRLWVSFDNTDAIREYDLSSPWDIGGVWTLSASIGIGAHVPQPRHVTLSSDGGVLFVADTSARFALYDLPTPGTVSGATLRRDFNNTLISQVVSGRNLGFPQFTRDGQYLIGSTSDSDNEQIVIEVYSLSIPWDETTRILVNSFTVPASVTVGHPGSFGSPENLTGDFYFAINPHVSGGTGVDPDITNLELMRLPALDFSTRLDPIQEPDLQRVLAGVPFSKLVAAKYTPDGRHIWLYDDQRDRLIIVALSAPYRPDMVTSVTVSDAEDFSSVVSNLREIIIKDDEASAFLVGGTSTLQIHEIQLLNGANDASRVTFVRESTLSGFSNSISAAAWFNGRFFIADGDTTNVTWPQQIREVTGEVGGILVRESAFIVVDNESTENFPVTGLAMSDDGLFLHALLPSSNSVRTYRLIEAGTLQAGSTLIRESTLPETLLGATSLDLSAVIASSGVAAGGGGGAGARGGDGISSPSGFSRAGGRGKQHAGGDARGPNSLQAGHGGSGRCGAAGGGGAITANGTIGRGQDGGSDGSATGASENALRGGGSGAGLTGSGSGGPGQITLLWEE